jgi:peptidoglycan hydrolase FlgJ
MINSMTGYDKAFISKEESSLSKLKTEIDNTKKEVTGKSFIELYNEKLKKDGTVDPAKLDKDEKKLYDTCVDLESLLWKQVLNSMKKTINKFKLLDGGNAEDIFSDMLYDQYSATLAKNASSGIADTIFRQLSAYK